jgi:amidase
MPPHGGFKSATPDCAFIEYWPEKRNPQRVRLAVKDLIDMKGVVTTAGSEFLAKHAPPAKRDAACLAIARQRPVDIVGKTNLTELAVGVSGINQYFGTPRNPVSSRRHLIPGGSSSGSAVAVATGEADVAFGTDTTGSIRLPAACCGVLGLKTTLGLVSLRGVYPIAPKLLDTVGPMAKDVPNLVEGMDLLEEGFAAKYQQAMAERPRGAEIRVGRLRLAGTDGKVDEAIDDALHRAGFKVVELPDSFRDAWKQADRDAKTVAATAAWMYDLKFAHEAQVRPRTKAVVLLGALDFDLHANRAALARQKAWRSALDRALKQVDFIALPTMQQLPPHVPLLGGTVAFEARVLALENTAPANFAGNPALAMPVPIRDKTVPVTSLQLVGRRFSEPALCNAARLVERSGRPGTQTSGPERAR